MLWGSRTVHLIQPAAGSAASPLSFARPCAAAAVSFRRGRRRRPRTGPSRAAWRRAQQHNGNARGAVEVRGGRGVPVREASRTER